jgi:carbamoyltransferase
MNYIGLSAGHHDATITILDSGGNILYSGGGGTPHLDRGIIIEAMAGVRGDYSLNYHERPWLKNLRMLWSGEGWSWDRNRVVDVVGVDAMRLLNPLNKRINTYNHHLSHCGGAFQCSPYDEATGIVIDAVGEWDCATIWRCEYRGGVAKYTLLWRQWYPRSIGLFYSAITRRCGGQPNVDEGRLMSLAADGEPLYVDELREICGGNLHRGCDWLLPGAEVADLAASAQAVFQEAVGEIFSRAGKIGGGGRMVYSGGCAFNAVANRWLMERWGDIWIPDNPGDGGSSLGCAALGYGGRIYTPHTTR